MAISFGGSVYDWDSASEIALWVVTGVLFCSFALTQIFHPFISEGLKLYPTRFFRKPTLLMLQMLAFCAAFCLFVSLQPAVPVKYFHGGAKFYLPLRRFRLTISLFSSSLPRYQSTLHWAWDLYETLTVGQDDTALEAAVRLLPFIFMVAVFALINGSSMAKLGYYYPWYLWGGGFTIVGASLMCNMNPCSA